MTLLRQTFKKLFKFIQPISENLIVYGFSVCYLKKTYLEKRKKSKY